MKKYCYSVSNNVLKALTGKSLCSMLNIFLIKWPNREDKRIAGGLEKTVKLTVHRVSEDV